MTPDQLEESLLDLRSEALEIIRPALGYDHLFRCIEEVLASRLRRAGFWRVTICLHCGTIYRFEAQVRADVLAMLREELPEIKNELKAMVNHECR